MNICKNCGYDLGNNYDNCGASEDGTCPSCGYCTPSSVHELLTILLPILLDKKIRSVSSLILDDSISYRLDKKCVHLSDIKGTFEEINKQYVTYLCKNYMVPAYQVNTLTRHNYCDIEVFVSSIGCCGESIYSACFKDEFTASLHALHLVIYREKHINKSST